jgi:hypothetical protein
VPLLGKNASAADKAKAQAAAYMLYTNFGVGNETYHPRKNPAGAYKPPAGD